MQLTDARGVTGMLNTPSPACLQASEWLSQQRESKGSSAKGKDKGTRRTYSLPSNVSTRARPSSTFIFSQREQQR